MCKRSLATSSILTGLLMISAGTAPATAATQINLSAANCIPRSGDHFNRDNANEGLLWAENNDGTFINRDAVNAQDLICAVPYDPLLLGANLARPSIEV